MTPSPTAAIRPSAGPKTLTILGSTGTIGRNTIQVIQSSPERFAVHALTARGNAALLAEQARALRPRWAVIENEAHYHALKEALAGTGIECLAGTQALMDIAGEKVDMLVSGIVGAAALAPTLAAIRRGTSIGLANKECLVCAGELVMQEARKHNAAILPIDSEHNAVFQCLEAGRRESVERITITASGGPFLNAKREEMERATPGQAVRHPNWIMGEKISVDSATMMNKGLELIEAHHLFGLPSSRLDILVHPESIVHCLVYYRDGTALSAMSVPDMRVPISYVLHWPDRAGGKVPAVDLAAIGKLTFLQPDTERFPALRLARQALESGGTAPAILNAANETAVDAFLAGNIGFLAIADIVERVLGRIPASALHSVEQALENDRLARECTGNLISRKTA